MDVDATEADTTEADTTEADHADVKREAHAALERWLDQCRPEALAAFESGRSGYIGRIKICAFAEDDDGGVYLRIERGFSEDI